MSAVEDQDLIMNTENLDCPLCLTLVQSGQGAVLRNCLHIFCRNCLSLSVENCQDVVVKCPFRNDDYSCESHLLEREIKTLVSAKLFEKYLQRSMKAVASLAENSFHCKTADCPGWCLLEDNVNVFSCPFCEQVNCLICAAIHEGKDCRQYQDELQFDAEQSQDAKMTKDYLDLLALEDQDLILNTENFECPVCLKLVQSGKGVVLKNCLHIFCRECLSRSVEYCEDAVIKCPFRNDDYFCDSHLLEREIKTLVSAELFEKHLQRSMNAAESLAENSFYCKTPDCPGWCLLEDNVSVFSCPFCEQVNCFTCGTIHEGKDCRQYQDDLYSALLSYDQLKSLEEQELILNNEDFECPICFTLVQSGEGAVLRDCLHSFCRECLSNSVEYCEDAVIKCPFRNDDYSCDSFLQEREIKTLVSAELYEKHLQRSIKAAENQAENSFHCKTTDCPGWCLFEDDVNVFACPVCAHVNCLTCAAIHEGKDCRQYQDELRLNAAKNEEAKMTKDYLDSMVAEKNAMHCPKCQIIITKKSGCDWLKCSMCRLEICWVTKGPRWGLAGSGDTSGGCKCNFNNLRCHPKCTYCH